MTSLGMAFTLVRGLGAGRLSVFQLRLEPLLLFSDLLEIETALSEMKTEKKNIEIALSLKLRPPCHISISHCLDSKFML